MRHVMLKFIVKRFIETFRQNEKLNMSIKSERLLVLLGLMRAIMIRLLA